jgi:hypothetical protein
MTMFYSEIRELLMRRMPSILSLLLGFALLFSQVLPSFAQVDAQEGSTSAGIGSPVPVTNDAGDVIGSVTIAEVTDPFTDTSPDYPAEPGQRYVVVRAIFDANAGTRFDIAPSAIVLQDQNGTLWDSTSLVLPDDAMVPQLSSQTLAPDSRVSGLIGFKLPEGVTPARIYFQPVSSRLVLLAELVAATLPPVGTAIPYTDSDGGTGQVTVREIIDPFTGVDPSYPVPEGSRYVYAALTFENTSDGAFHTDSYDLLLQDANGDLWSPEYVSRTGDSLIIPDLGWTQLAPGDRLTGAVVFAVPTEAQVTGLYSSPTGEQLLPLAAPSASGAPSDTTVVDVTPTEESTTEEDASTPVPALVTPEPEVSADPCTELQDWLLAGTDRILTAQGLADDARNATDGATLTDISSQFAEMADDEALSDVPAGGEAAEKALVATLRALSSATADAAAAQENGDDTTESLDLVSRAQDRLAAIQSQMAVVTGNCVSAEAG